MTVWRVEVCGLSHRYFEAESRDDAEEQVRRARLAGLDVRAAPAPREIERAYVTAGPLQRKKLLARLDGLTNPRERQGSRSALRRLERQVERARWEQEWVEGRVRSAAPVSPDVIDHLMRVLAPQHIEQHHLRLPEWDRHSPAPTQRP